MMMMMIMIMGSKRCRFFRWFAIEALEADAELMRITETIRVI